jgi:hypothetical protein
VVLLRVEALVLQARGPRAPLLNRLLRWVSLSLALLRHDASVLVLLQPYALVQLAAASCTEPGAVQLYECLGWKGLRLSCSDTLVTLSTTSSRCNVVCASH